MLNKRGDRRGCPGVRKSTGPLSKPCLLCQEAIVRRTPSELKRLRVHKKCEGKYRLRALAFKREDRIRELFSTLTPREQELVLTGYRLGARHTQNRLKMRELRKAA